MPATTDRATGREPAPTRPTKMDAILAVSNGDIVLIGTSYYHVVTVREPTHPAAPGVVWEGFWWRAALGHWGKATVLHAHDGLPYTPQVLTPEDRVRCGFGDV